MQQELPIGISSFEKLVKENLLYIDKTKILHNLVKNGSYYFLSRPRRFGKTLFLDTLKQAFLGRQELFKGLYLENNWDWSKAYPIIHISFSGDNFGIDGVLDIRINSELQDVASLYGIKLERTTNGAKLGELISKLHQKTGMPAVILVDEYDKGILDAIDNTELAIKNREILKGFYRVIKEHDADLKFVFVTGVTKFAKAGIFSQLNNLNDITFNNSYADICGYTQNDIETAFRNHLVGVDLSLLKRWYNGYNFLGSDSQKVYNPFDILLFITNGNKYKNYWFETGTPGFLIKLLQKSHFYFPSVEGMRLTDAMLGSFDIENLSIEVLLLQSGYLTIRKTEVDEEGLNSYILDYPNFEVKQSLNDRVLNSLFGNLSSAISEGVFGIKNLLLENKIGQLEFKLKSLFASIPHDWYRNNNMQNYEGYYCSIVYTLFNTMGYNVIPEDKTSLGQIDLTVKLSDKILIVEFKMLSSSNAKNALEQVKEKKYHEKYLSQNKPVYVIGIAFDDDTRNICEYAWEKIN